MAGGGLEKLLQKKQSPYVIYCLRPGDETQMERKGFAANDASAKSLVRRRSLEGHSTGKGEEGSLEEEEGFAYNTTRSQGRIEG